MARRSSRGGAQGVGVNSGGLGGRFIDAGYAKAFAVVVDESAARSPEQWVRSIFEDAPRIIRWGLLLGWKLVLGLRLGPLASPECVLGWRISGQPPGSVDLRAESPLMTAHKVLLNEDAQLVLATFLYFKRPWSRLIWSIVAPVHHRTEPYLLARAARLSSRRAST